MGIFSVPFENVAVSAAQDFFEIAPADDKPVRLLGFNVDNVGGTADAGDSQEEFWRVAVVRGHSSSGSGGGTVTSPHRIQGTGAGTASFTAEINNTTIASAGSPGTIVAMGINVRAPGFYWFPERVEPTASQADSLIVVRLLSTPADSINLSGTLFVEEIGS